MSPTPRRCLKKASQPSLETSFESLMINSPISRGVGEVRGGVLEVLSLLGWGSRSGVTFPASFSFLRGSYTPKCLATLGCMLTSFVELGLGPGGGVQQLASVYGGGRFSSRSFLVGRFSTWWAGYIGGLGQGYLVRGTKTRAKGLRRDFLAGRGPTSNESRAWFGGGGLGGNFAAVILQPPRHAGAGVKALWHQASSKLSCAAVCGAWSPAFPQFLLHMPLTW